MLLKIETVSQIPQVNGRPVTSLELETLSFLMKVTKNGKKSFIGSNRYIARSLNRSSSGIIRAIIELKKAGLIEIKSLLKIRSEYCVKIEEVNRLGLQKFVA